MNYEYHQSCLFSYICKM